jgi:hypothetical protein
MQHLAFRLLESLEQQPQDEARRRRLESNIVQQAHKAHRRRLRHQPQQQQQHERDEQQEQQDQQEHEQQEQQEGQQWEATQILCGPLVDLQDDLVAPPKLRASNPVSIMLTASAPVMQNFEFPTAITVPQILGP